MKTREVYNKLEKNYGKQGWWPRYENGEFIYGLKYGPISSLQRFIIIISAILTQNTSWKNVERTIKNLDKFNFLRKESIKQLDEELLGQLIRSSGYFKQKARKLKNFVEFLDSGKEITRKNLLNIWGVGKETADSILLYAYDKPVFVIDAYTMRIMKRLGFKFRDYDELQEIFMKELPMDAKLFNEFHALFVKLGKEACKSKPLCENCCLKKKCEYFKETF